ncbi:biotin-dependent 3-methylcrotonyl-coenzyme A carboxylase beta1 subunit-like isoform X2 [Gigantopelta aegis]|uniref:biotin-dependent 3-methylcrotonyl-coenzyme A carboxylase beta1 subunit-like isoform X2 n=1 Tax=Gigantopelta aegis TaxID=1735272 RepID=UPI001B88E6E1|nr:biotin-dependent 3-methylcrotonyl-coenzyme A carboxylase beta1 subunit-like isoform X2 [Gigantopelta aegis]
MQNCQALVVKMRCLKIGLINALCNTRKTIFCTSALCTNHHNENGAPNRKNNIPFPILDFKVDKHGADFMQNYEASKHKENLYLQILQKSLAGGGEKAIERHTKRNKKLLVQDRIKLLFDDCTKDFFEMSPIAGLGMEYGDIARAGIVIAIGKIVGRYCLVVANDATVKGGVVYPITLKKQLRAQEIAVQNRLPCVYLVDSGGAFLPLQSEIFNPGGQAFYNEAVMGAKQIPQVAVVCGSCTAGGAYVPTMADETVIVHKSGTIFLGGPPLVQAATGEVVTAEELGGATLHCRVSGCTDYFAETEPEAFEMARDIVTSLNLPAPPPPPCTPVDPLYDPDELSGLVPVQNQHQMNMHEVIARVVDGSRFQEFKKLFGPTLLTGFAYICGHLVGIVANQGELTEVAAVKGCHFVQMCAERHIPLIFLQNTVPDIQSKIHAQNTGISLSQQLKAQAAMLSVVSCAAVPKITIIVGNGLGYTHYVMGGRAVNPNFLFTWPNAVTGMMEPEALAKLITQEKLESTTTEEAVALQTKLTERYTSEMSTAFTSARVLDDGIILPQDTRKVIGQCLMIVKAYLPLVQTDYSVLRL